MSVLMGDGPPPAKKLCPSIEDLSQDARTNLPCPVSDCQRVLPQSSSLRMHLKMVHNVHWSGNKWNAHRSQPVQFHCPVIHCNYGITSERFFSTFSLLKQHYMRLHAEKTLKCDYCCAAFSLQRFLRSHQAKCPSNPERKQNNSLKIYENNAQNLSGSSTKFCDSFSCDDNTRTTFHSQSVGAGSFMESDENVPLSDTTVEVGEPSPPPSLLLPASPEDVSMECCVVVDNSAPSSTAHRPSHKTDTASQDHNYVQPIPTLEKIPTKKKVKPKELPDILPKPNVYIYPMTFQPGIPVERQILMISDTQSHRHHQMPALQRIMPKPCKISVNSSSSSHAVTTYNTQEPRHHKETRKRLRNPKSANTQTDDVRKRKKWRYPPAVAATQTGVRYDGTSAETQTSGDLILKQAMESADIPMQRQSQASQVSPAVQTVMEGSCQTCDDLTSAAGSLPYTALSGSTDMNKGIEYATNTTMIKGVDFSTNTAIHKGVDFSTNTAMNKGVDFSTNTTMNKGIDFATNTDKPARKSQGLQIEMQLHAETQTLQNSLLSSSSCTATQTLESFLLKDVDTGVFPASGSAVPIQQTVQRKEAAAVETGMYLQKHAAAVAKTTSVPPNSSTAYYRWMRNKDCASSKQSGNIDSEDSNSSSRITTSTSFPVQAGTNRESPPSTFPAQVGTSRESPPTHSDLLPDSEVRFSNIRNFDCLPPASLATTSSSPTNLPSARSISGRRLSSLSTDNLFSTFTSHCPMPSYEMLDNPLQSQSFTDMCTNTDMDILGDGNVDYQDMQTTTDFDLPTFLDTDTQTVELQTGWNQTESQTQTLETQRAAETQATSSSQDSSSSSQGLDFENLWSHMETQTSADDFLAGLGLVDIETQTQPHIGAQSRGAQSHHQMGTTAQQTQQTLNGYDPCMNTVQTQTIMSNPAPTDMVTGAAGISTDSTQTQTLFDSFDLTETQLGSLLGDL